MKCVIMAGGKGTRLWPLSRKSKPKQFQSLVSDKTMLQETYLRMRKKFAVEDIFVSTNEEYISEVEKEILELPKENIIGEPTPRGSGPSLALTTAIIDERERDATVGIFTADHLIKNPKLLYEAIDAAEVYLKKNPDYIVTLGIKPKFPETGFGYIEQGKLIQRSGKLKIFEAERFVEKPDLETAQKYLKAGNYFWSSGMYFFRMRPLMKKFEKYVPDTYDRMMRIRNAVGTAEYDVIMREEYPQMDKIDFAFSIVENDDKVALIPLDLDWSDIGSWAALKDTLGKKGEHFAKGEHLDFGSENLMVYGSKKLITTIGLKDLIIIDTEDATLICDRHKAKMVSDVVKKLEEDGKITML